MPQRRPLASAGSNRRAWCPSGASRSREVTVPSDDLSSEEALAQFANRHCNSQPNKLINSNQPVKPDAPAEDEERPQQKDVSLEEIPDDSSLPPASPPTAATQQKRRPTQPQSKKDELDFAYLKDGLRADSSREPDGREARRAALQSVEAALADAQARADRLVELAAAAAGSPGTSDAAGEPACCDDGGRCSTIEEARQLKRCIAGLGEILLRLRRDQPVSLAAKAEPARGGRCCNGPKLVACPHSGRNRLAELRSRYERSLLLTPTDVSWPFVHLIAPAWPAPPSAAEDCRPAS